ncbi:hypothetical protein EDC04DRAFT_2616206 [Pisolithus marmoratus]|nr:hypothetical protein EDC04DRAFT_2616206 [Pisolithus marmoratus]
MKYHVVINTEGQDQYKEKNLLYLKLQNTFSGVALLDHATVVTFPVSAELPSSWYNTPFTLFHIEVTVIVFTGYPVASLKCKISEDTLRVFPQQKVTWLVLLLMAAKDDKPHGRRAVPSKPKHSEKFANVHLSKKVALLAPPVIICLLMPAWLLMTTKDGGQVVPLKHKHSEEFLSIHPPSKIAHEIAITTPTCTHPIQCYTVESAPGDPVLQNQICSMWSLPNKLLIAITTHLPKDSLWTDSNHGDLEALSVWRRTNAFIMPVSIWFPIAEATTDNDLNALSIFFESLQGSSGCQGLHCPDVQ